MIALSCVLCHGVLDLTADSATCRACGHIFVNRNGVWRMLRPERLAPLENFLADYTKIRLAEGRGSPDPSFYRNLPDCPAGHPLSWQWAIRRRTFSCFLRRVLPVIGPRRRILDLGAGTGWLSNRLAQLGHDPCAVDLSCDDQDGLEAARHFDPPWPRIQAEFDYLPLADASVDVVIFNASLHYSTDYPQTLREALRVLAPGGFLVVLETPVYRRDASGRQMVEERRQLFLQRYGTRSDSLPSLEYLTWPRIAQLGSESGLHWRIVRPWYGVKWALRPWLARIRRKREPSRFPILFAQVEPRP